MSGLSMRMHESLCLNELVRSRGTILYKGCDTRDFFEAAIRPCWGQTLSHSERQTIHHSRIKRLYRHPIQELFEEIDVIVQVVDPEFRQLWDVHPQSNSD